MNDLSPKLNGILIIPINESMIKQHYFVLSNKLTPEYSQSYKTSDKTAYRLLSIQVSRLHPHTPAQYGNQDQLNEFIHYVANLCNVQCSLTCCYMVRAFW
jgi:hypothetical protein